MIQETGESIVFKHAISYKVKETEINKELEELELTRIEYVHTYYIFYEKQKTFFLGNDMFIYLDSIKFNCRHPSDHEKVNKILERIGEKLNKRLSKEPMKKLIKELLENECNNTDILTEEGVIKNDGKIKNRKEIKKEIREIIDKSCKKVDFKLCLNIGKFITDNMIYIPWNEYERV